MTPDEKKEILKAYFCLLLPRKKGSFCNNCKMCKKINEIFSTKDEENYSAETRVRTPFKPEGKRRTLSNSGVSSSGPGHGYNNPQTNQKPKEKSLGEPTEKNRAENSDKTADNPTGDEGKPKSHDISAVEQSAPEGVCAKCGVYSAFHPVTKYDEAFKNKEVIICDEFTPIKKDVSEMFISLDYRDEKNKTDIFCNLCRKDLNPEKSCFGVYIRNFTPPTMVKVLNKLDTDELVLIGNECQKKIPNEYKVNILKAKNKDVSEKKGCGKKLLDVDATEEQGEDVYFVCGITEIEEYNNVNGEYFSKIYLCEDCKKQERGK